MQGKFVSPYVSCVLIQVVQCEKIRVFKTLRNICLSKKEKKREEIHQPLSLYFLDKTY